MLRYELDDPLDAVAVHGGGGNQIRYEYKQCDTFIISNDYKCFDLI